MYYVMLPHMMVVAMPGGIVLLANVYHNVTSIQDTLLSGSKI